MSIIATITPRRFRAVVIREYRRGTKYCASFCMGESRFHIESDTWARTRMLTEQRIVNVVRNQSAAAK